MWTIYMLPHAVGCAGTLLVRAHICVSDCIPQKHCRSRKHKTKSANNQTASTSSQNLYHNLINHLSDNGIAVNWIWWHCSSGKEWSTYCIRSYSSPRKLFFFEFGICSQFESCCNISIFLLDKLNFCCGNYPSVGNRKFLLERTGKTITKHLEKTLSMIQI